MNTFESSRSQNLEGGQEPLPDMNASAGMTVREAISKLEAAYSVKDTEVKTAQDELVKAQTRLNQCEHDALVLLRQLAPLQNRFLMDVIESQRTKLEMAASSVPLTE